MSGIGKFPVQTIGDIVSGTDLMLDNNCFAKVQVAFFRQRSILQYMENRLPFLSVVVLVLILAFLAQIQSLCF